MIGITELPTSIYCMEEALTVYEGAVGEIPITIHFPLCNQRLIDPVGRLDLVAPSTVNGLIRETRTLEWGYMIHYNIKPAPGRIKDWRAAVKIIAVEFEGDNNTAQNLYLVFDKWIERFLQYCLLCNRQLMYVTKSEPSGGNTLEIVGENGYIHPDKPKPITIEFSMIPEEACVKKFAVEKAIEYASSSKKILTEYAFMQQAYEAENIGAHRLAVINACSALEMSLTKAIEGYCADHDIDSQLIFKKYRYLRDLIEFLAETDSQFVIKDELITNVVRLRNDVMHCNRNPYPSGSDTIRAINSVCKTLGYFYDDYAE